MFTTLDNFLQMLPIIHHITKLVCARHHMVYSYLKAQGQKGRPQHGTWGRNSGCNSSWKQKHREEKPHGVYAVKVKQWALGSGQPTYPGFDCLDSGCSHEGRNEGETERKENSAAWSQINGSWLQSAVGGWCRVCSGGLTLGSGRDRLLAHPISLWTTVSTISVTEPVAVRVGGGRIQCMEETVRWALPEAGLSWIREVVMRPYVLPSTHPFSVNLYLGLIGVMSGVLEPLAADTGQE